MNLYIEDVNGNVYYFNKVSFRDNLGMQGELVKLKDEEVGVQMVKLIDIFKMIFSKSNPNYNMDLFEEEILEYNLGEIGIENLIKLVNMVIEQVFQSKGTNTNKYAFLQDNPQ